MVGAKRGPDRVVARIAQANANRRLRQQREVVVVHAAHGLKRVRGVVDLNVGVGGVQRIREVVVVEEVPVAADRRVEVVPLVLGEPHAAGVFRITAPSKARQEQVVKQATLVIERAHVESLFEQARAFALIDKRVVDRLAAMGLTKR